MTVRNLWLYYVNYHVCVQWELENDKPEKHMGMKCVFKCEQELCC